MRTLLKIFLISTSLYACNDSSDYSRETMPADTPASASALPADSFLKDNSSGPARSAEMDAEAEKKRQATQALLSSKEEINLLRAEISDSLTKTGLSPQRRSLFSKTIRQLENSSDLVDKQLEQVMVSDLRTSRSNLDGIVKKMKESDKQLGSIITHIDKITSYLQVATDLIQSLLPVKIPASRTGGKNN